MITYKLPKIKWTQKPLPTAFGLRRDLTEEHARELVSLVVNVILMIFTLNGVPHIFREVLDQLRDP